MLYCVAFDPGPTRTGVAVVGFDGGRFELLFGRHVEFGGGFFAAGQRFAPRGESDVRFLVEDAAQAAPILPARSELAPLRPGAPARPAPAGALVAVEQLIGYAYEAKRVQALIETARVEGRLIEVARRRGFEPVLIAAKEWRGALCRSESASDDQVRIVVEGLLHGIPALRAVERPHVYDAAGLAIVALARAAVLPLCLPAPVETALWRQQQAEKSARTAARAAGGAAKEPRGMTRLQRGRRSEGGRKGRGRRRST